MNAEFTTLAKQPKLRCTYWPLKIQLPFQLSGLLIDAINYKKKVCGCHNATWNVTNNSIHQTGNLATLAIFFTGKINENLSAWTLFSLSITCHSNWIQRIGGWIFIPIYSGNSLEFGIDKYPQKEFLTTNAELSLTTNHNLNIVPKCSCHFVSYWLPDQTRPPSGFQWKQI